MSEHENTPELDAFIESVRALVRLAPNDILYTLHFGCEVHRNQAAAILAMADWTEADVLNELLGRPSRGE